MFTTGFALLFISSVCKSSGVEVGIVAKPPRKQSAQPKQPRTGAHPHQPPWEHSPRTMNDLRKAATKLAAPGGTVVTSKAESNAPDAVELTWQQKKRRGQEAKRQAAAAAALAAEMLALAPPLAEGRAAAQPVASSAQPLAKSLVAPAAERQEEPRRQRREIDRRNWYREANPTKLRDALVLPAAAAAEGAGAAPQTAFAPEVERFHPSGTTNAEVERLKAKARAAAAAGPVSQWELKRQVRKMQEMRARLKANGNRRDDSAQLKADAAANAAEDTGASIAATATAPFAAPLAPPLPAAPPLQAKPKNAALGRARAARTGARGGAAALLRKTARDDKEAASEAVAATYIQKVERGRQERLRLRKVEQERLEQERLEQERLEQQAASPSSGYTATRAKAVQVAPISHPEALKEGPPMLPLDIDEGNGSETSADFGTKRIIPDDLKEEPDVTELEFHETEQSPTGRANINKRTVPAALKEGPPELPDLDLNDGDELLTSAPKRTKRFIPEELKEELKEGLPDAAPLPDEPEEPQPSRQQRSSLSVPLAQSPATPLLALTHEKPSPDAAASPPQEAGALLAPGANGPPLSLQEDELARRIIAEELARRVRAAGEARLETQQATPLLALTHKEPSPAAAASPPQARDLPSTLPNGTPLALEDSQWAQRMYAAEMGRARAAEQAKLETQQAAAQHRQLVYKRGTAANQTAAGQTSGAKAWLSAHSSTPKAPAANEGVLDEPAKPALPDDDEAAAAANEKEVDKAAETQLPDDDEEARALPSTLPNGAPLALEDSQWAQRMYAEEMARRVRAAGEARLETQQARPLALTFNRPAPATVPARPLALAFKRPALAPVREILRENGLQRRYREEWEANARLRKQANRTKLRHAWPQLKAPAATEPARSVPRTRLSKFDTIAAANEGWPKTAPNAATEAEAETPAVQEEEPATENEIEMAEALATAEAPAAPQEGKPATEKAASPSQARALLLHHEAQGAQPERRLETDEVAAGIRADQEARAQLEKQKEEEWVAARMRADQDTAANQLQRMVRGRRAKRQLAKEAEEAKSRLQKQTLQIMRNLRNPQKGISNIAFKRWLRKDLPDANNLMKLSGYKKLSLLLEAMPASVEIHYTKGEDKSHFLIFPEGARETKVQDKADKAHDQLDKRTEAMEALPKDKEDAQGEQRTGEEISGEHPDDEPPDEETNDDPWADPTLKEADATLQRFSANLKKATDRMSELHEHVTLGLKTYQEALRHLGGNAGRLQDEMKTMLKEEGIALQLRNAARIAPFAELDDLIAKHHEELAREDAKHGKEPARERNKENRWGSVRRLHRWPVVHHRKSQLG